jgi:hypothetical protein
LREPLEELLAAAAEGHDFALGRAERGHELPQVGSGDERAGLARLDDQPREVLSFLKLVEVRRQLFQDRDGEDIRPFSRQVEREQGHVGLRKRELQGLGHRTSAFSRW